MYYVLYKGIQITLTVKIVLTLIELHENMKQRLWGSCGNIEEHKSIGKILRGRPWKCRYFDGIRYNLSALGIKNCRKKYLE